MTNCNKQRGIGKVKTHLMFHIDFFAVSSRLIYFHVAASTGDMVRSKAMIATCQQLNV